MSDGQHVQPHMRTTVNLASQSEKAAAEALMARKYSQCGYGTGHILPDGCATFVAISGTTLVGTLSLAVDGSNGLPSDASFRHELDAMRSAGAKLCELTRFVTDLPSPSVTILSMLFAVIHDHGVRHHDCTDLVITADARHRGFYLRKWGFEYVGAARRNTASGVMSQLMRVRVDAIQPSNDNRFAQPKSLGGLSSAPIEERSVGQPLTRLAQTRL